jgi:hypothetical protein
MRADDKRLIRLQDAARILGVHRTTALRMFRTSSTWGRFKGQRCRVVTLRQVRAAALPHVENGSTEARLAKLEAQLEALTEVLTEEAPTR